MRKSITVFYEIGLTVLFTVLTLTLSAQIKPNNFPVESAPDSSNFEIYSQKNNHVRRANLFALKKYFAPYIQSIAYQPAATGNTTHLTEIVSTPNGKVYYIDGQGKATQLYGTQAIHHDATMTGDGTSGSPLSVVAAADDQTITANKIGSNVTIMIEDGNSTTFSIDDADANPTNEIQVLSKNDDTNLVTLSKSGGSFTDEVDDADHDTLNEIQFLSYDPVTDSLTLSNGNKVYLGDLASDNQTLSVVSDSLKILRGNAVHRSQFDKQKLHVRSKSGNNLTMGIDYGDDVLLNIADEDSSYINELQDLVFNPANDSLHIQYGNTVYLGSLIKDSSPTNEAQTLTKSGSTITLSSVSGVGGGSVTDEVNDADANPTNEAQTITKSGSTVTLTSVSGVGGGTYADSDNQALSINGNQLTISGGNTVTLNPNDADANPTNEIQYLGLNGNVLSITGGNYVTLPAGSSGGSGADNWGTQYVVTDATLIGTGLISDSLRINSANPIFADQTISKDDVTNIVSLDKDGGTFVDEVDDADHDPVNEAQTISKSGSTVTLTAVSGFGGGSFSIDDADANPTNEAQTLTKSGNTITLSSVSGSGGGSVTDTDTDAQTLSLSGSDLSISGGNTVTLPLGSGGDNWGTQVVVHDATLSGSGTASSNLTVAASAASKWTTTGSDIYNSNSGSVGIGTAGAPQRKLEVSFNNSANTNLPLRLTNTATSGTNYTGLEAYTGGIKSFDLLGNVGDVRLRVVDNVPLKFYTNNTERGSFSNTGDFSLVTKLITPALQVTTSAAAGKVLTSDASGNATWQTSSGVTYSAGFGLGLSGNVFYNSRYFKNQDSLFVKRAYIEVTSAPDPFDDALTATRVTATGNYLINYIGASAHLITSNVGGSAGIFQIGLHYNGSDYYCRTATNGNTWRPWRRLWHSGDFSSSDITNWNSKDPSSTNEAQTISKTGSTVTLTSVSGSGGGSFTDAVDDADANPTNEAQTLSKVGSTITLSSVSGSGGGSVSDIDTDDQTLTFTSSTDQLAISEGNNVSLAKYNRRFMLATNSTSHTLSSSLSVIPFSSASGTTSYFTFNNTDDSITPSEGGTYRFQFIANLNDTSSNEDLSEFGFYGSGGLLGFAYNNFPRFIANPTKTYINYEWVQYLESGDAFQVKGDGTNMNLSANYTFLIEKISN